jgi:thiamine biosynthesis lipoprotein
MSKTVCAVMAFLVATRLTASWADEELRRYAFEQTLIGQAINITLYAPDQRSANLAAEAAYARIAELDRILSDYKADSELSQLSATAGSGRSVALGRDLWTVLERSQKLAAETGGEFDVTVGPYVRLWRRARRNKEFPATERLDEARQAVGYQKLKLDASKHSATLVAPGMRLDLGGIATGYAVDEAMAVLRDRGIASALIDASGDILVSDPPPGQKGWRIGIAPLEADGPPSRHLSLRNAAVTTSGDAFQHVVLNGQRYSHIVDPATGLGLTDRSSVTVIAADCITADSVATAVCVMGPQNGLKLIEAIPHAAGYIVQNRNGGTETFSSDRLHEYVSEHP